jgi:hypothetical protein
MSESTESSITIETEQATASTPPPLRTGGYGHAGEPPRRVVGVVRILRGRLAAPCRCCSDAAATHENS